MLTAPWRCRDTTSTSELTVIGSPSPLARVLLLPSNPRAARGEKEKLDAPCSAHPPDRRRNARRHRHPALSVAPLVRARLSGVATRRARARRARPVSRSRQVGSLRVLALPEIRPSLRRTRGAEATDDRAEP